jgi:hypothetical protein
MVLMGAENLVALKQRPKIKIAWNYPTLLNKRKKINFDKLKNFLTKSQACNPLHWVMCTLLLDY